MILLNFESYEQMYSILKTITIHDPQDLFQGEAENDGHQSV